MPDADALLDRARAGDDDAFRRLVGQLYNELRAIARTQRHRLGASDTVNTTAVVHEAYAKLGARRRAGETNGSSGAAGDGLAAGGFTDRTHFLRVAARAMRDVIVDHARAQHADKRGGHARAVTLLDGVGASAVVPDPAEVLSVHDALHALEALDPEAARVTELRYFGGLSVEETADALGLSPATVKRRWTVARAWLYQRLAADGPASGLSNGVLGDEATA